MKPYQQRVIDEKNELDNKVSVLRNFLGSKVFAELSEHDRVTLRKQEHVMSDYATILSSRIMAFN